MRSIFSIVEGHGEVDAVPALLQRLARLAHVEVKTPRPFRIKRDLLVKPGELERAVEFAARATTEEDLILVLIDGDDDPACALGPTLLDRAQKARPGRRISVVIAVREFEAWLAAAIDSLSGYRGLALAAERPSEPERMRDPKGWLTSLLPVGEPYSPTLDQAAMTKRIDITAARRAPSFDKLCRDVEAFFRAGVA